jgi:hypothetical protein
MYAKTFSKPASRMVEETKNGECSKRFLMYWQDVKILKLGKRDVSLKRHVITDGSDRYTILHIPQPLTILIDNILYPSQLQSIGSNFKGAHLNLHAATLDDIQLLSVILKHVRSADTFYGHIAPGKNALTLSTKGIVDTHDDAPTLPSR